MASTQTLNAQFTTNDAFIGTIGQRTDAYNLTVSQIGNVTISSGGPGFSGFAAFDPTGNIVANGAPGTSFTASPGLTYKIETVDASSIPQNYTIQADVATGDVTLTPAANAFTNTQTGASVTPAGQLDSTDLLDVAPVTPSLSDIAPFDEYQLDVSLVGQTVDVAVTSTTSGFDPFVQVLDGTGSVVVADDNSGGGVNPLASFFSMAGTDYRIRVTDANGFPANDTASYQLQASVPAGTVSVTPRESVPVVNADDPSLVPGSSVARPRPGEYERIDKTTSPSEFDVFFLSEGNDNYDLADAPPPTEPPMGVLAKERFVIGLEGDDTLTGTVNRDFPATGNQGADRFDLMAGPDVAIGGKDSDILNGGDGDDQLGGNRGIDRVDGGNGNDSLLGGQGEDLLLGGNGDDGLLGDVGQDILIGGADSDTFILRADAAAAADAIADADVIVDFNAAEDNLALKGATFADVNLQAATVVRNNTVSSATAIQLNATGEYLGIVSGVEPSAIDASNFVAAPF